MHFMLQKEVVDAHGRGARTREHYGRLTVMLAPRLRVEPLFDIGAGAFRRRRSVVSTFVRARAACASRRSRCAIPRATHASSPRRSRSGARRCATRSQALLDADAIRAAGIDPGARPETLRTCTNLPRWRAN